MSRPFAQGHVENRVHTQRLGRLRVSQAVWDYVVSINSNIDSNHLGHFKFLFLSEEMVISSDLKKTKKHFGRKRMGRKAPGTPISRKGMVPLFSEIFLHEIWRHQFNRPSGRQRKACELTKTLKLLPIWSAVRRNVEHFHNMNDLLLWLWSTQTFICSGESLWFYPTFHSVSDKFRAK